MNIVFRVDASIEMGTGHLMRCVTLATEMQRRGANCHFVCRGHAAAFTERIDAVRCEVTLLPFYSEIKPEAVDGPAHASWLGVDWHLDAEQTAKVVSDPHPDWLVVDHYALDARWERQLRPFCRRIMVIDDLADRPHDCDLLLDQNLGRTFADYSALVPGSCTILTGPQYALLRPDFAALRRYSLARRQHPRLERLLITMGGVDKDNATGRVLDALRENPLPADCNIVVVMGRQAPWLDQVREQAATMPWSTQVIVDVHEMASLMADSDLAIGAAGSSSWERCCLGVPSLLLVVADNQRNVAALLDQADAVRMLQLDADLPTQLACLINEMSQSEVCLRQLSDSARAITDGKGTQRVADELMTETDNE